MYLKMKTRIKNSSRNKLFFNLINLNKLTDFPGKNIINSIYASFPRISLGGYRSLRQVMLLNAECRLKTAAGGMLLIIFSDPRV